MYKQLIVKITKVNYGLLSYANLGQQYNLTGSSKFAVLGETFIWTCELVAPSGNVPAVKFAKNNNIVGTVGYQNSRCIDNHASDYIFGCLSETKFTLTIPATTESEQNSVWRCEYANNQIFRSGNVTLTVSSKKNIRQKRILF